MDFILICISKDLAKPEQPSKWQKRWSRSENDSLKINAELCQQPWGAFNLVRTCGGEIVGQYFIRALLAMFCCKLSKSINESNKSQNLNKSVNNRCTIPPANQVCDLAIKSSFQSILLPLLIISYLLSILIFVHINFAILFWSYQNLQMFVLIWLY